MSEPLEAGEVRIFVYGTLVSSGGAAELMRGCRRLGAAQVSGTLYDVAGRYPALVLGGAGAVHGEVWACPAARLERLDLYEGVEEGLFRRVQRTVAGAPCWVYVAGPRLEPALREENVVPGGRWPPEDGAR